jgi:hypothetical protein
MPTTAPPSLKVQLAKLFGAASAEARSETRTPAQWRKTLRKLLDELYEYAKANVETDELHWLMICSSFAAAMESLKDEDFWPGYTEGLIRLSLLLMGDYPDHRRRKTGKKKDTHYKLNRLRTLHYSQDADQRVRTIFTAKAAGFPALTASPRDALARFREESGGGSYRDFMSWYKLVYPEDYAALF